MLRCVTHIGTQAFSGCSKLADITMSDGVIEIGRFAFRDCTNLSTLSIPDSVATIGMQAFRAVSYTHLTLPTKA